MNEVEKKVISLSADLWNEFLKLEQYHPDDVHDIRFHIHAIQSIVMKREAERNNPLEFKILTVK
jgi:hypothetical protein